MLESEVLSDCLFDLSFFCGKKIKKQKKKIKKKIIKNFTYKPADRNSKTNWTS